MRAYKKNKLKLVICHDSRNISKLKSDLHCHEISSKRRYILLLATEIVHIHLINNKKFSSINHRWCVNTT